MKVRITGKAYQNNKVREFEEIFTGTQQQLNKYIEKLQTQCACDVENIEIIPKSEQ